MVPDANNSHPPGDAEHNPADGALQDDQDKGGVSACNQKIDAGMVHDAQSTAPSRRAAAMVERRGSVGNYQATTKNRNTHDRQYVAIRH